MRQPFPDSLVQYVKAYNEARVEFAAKMIQRRSTLERRVSELDGEIDRIINMVAKGIGNADRLTEDYGKRCDEFAQAEAELALEPEPITPVSLHPAALEAYSDDLHVLAAAINDGLETGYAEFGQVSGVWCMASSCGAERNRAQLRSRSRAN